MEGGGPGSGPIQQPPVVFDAGFEEWALAVGGALGATGHLSARCEPQEGFGDPEGLFVVAAPLVGMAADELFGDARLVQADGHFDIRVLQCSLGLRVALHRGLEAAQRVVLRLDPVSLDWIQAEEIRGFSRGLPPAEDASQPPQNQRKTFPPDVWAQV